MSDKFKATKVQLPRRAEIKTLLCTHKIEELSPKTDMSDEDAILQQCGEIAGKTGLSIDELASYFYSLAFEANPVQPSPLEEFMVGFYERVYTVPRSAIRQSSM